MAIQGCGTVGGVPLGCRTAKRRLAMTTGEGSAFSRVGVTRQGTRMGMKWSGLSPRAGRPGRKGESMGKNLGGLSNAQRERLVKLGNLPDATIDTSDIPEICEVDWKDAERGRFFGSRILKRPTWAKVGAG